MLTRAPAQYVVIGFFDRAGDFGPEILTLNPLAFTGCGLAAKFGIVDEQVEHALKICLVSTQTPAAMASRRTKDRPSSSDGSTNKAALEWFSTPSRTASIVQRSGCRAASPERAREARRTMAKCESARRLLGEEFRVRVPVPVKSSAPMDGDCFGLARSGAGAGRDLYRAERFCQSRCSGSGGRDRVGGAAPPGLVSPGSPEYSSSSLA